ncbi:hypothetical protein [Alkaliphilus hydrothermalis]|uniref:hypothetical protein n=1 Tax=Alkaliphilus hydrothermalis TaxID=1482730 RepID=UPI00195F2386|nr:hypothetical protein [Alkaliphilus hydrothermalis]
MDATSIIAYNPRGSVAPPKGLDKDDSTKLDSYESAKPKNKINDDGELASLDTSI